MISITRMNPFSDQNHNIKAVFELCIHCYVLNIVSILFPIRQGEVE